MPSKPKTDEIGPLLRRSRDNSGFTVRELAANVGVSFPYISKIENDDEFTPSADLLIRIAHAVGVDPDRFLVAAGKAPPDIIERLSTDLEFVKRVRTLMEGE